MSREAFAEIMSSGAEPPAQQQDTGRKFGEGHADAMIRAGFKEIAQALVAFPSSSIHPIEEPGLVGNPTQPMVTEQMGGVENVSPEFNLKEILNAPSPPTPPTQERDIGREM
jgi:hypothetical protein